MQRLVQGFAWVRALWPDAEVVSGHGGGLQQDTHHAGASTGVCMGAGTVA